MADMDNVVIPCELCDEPVWLSSYEEHASNCPSRNHEHALMQRLLDFTGSRRSVVMLGMPDLEQEQEQEQEQGEQLPHTNASEDDAGSVTGGGVTDTDDGTEAFSLTALIQQGSTLSIRGRAATTQEQVQTEREGDDLWSQLAQTLAAATPSYASAVSLSFRGDYEQNELISELMGGSHRVGVTSVDAVTSIVDGCGDMCPICQDTSEGEVRETACGHTFCGGCIETWLKNSKKCPVCMTELESHEV